MSPDQTGGVKVGHAALALDLPQLALSVIKKVLDALFVQEERLVCCPSIYARALILAAKGHLRLGELRLAEGATAVVLGMARHLSLDDCLETMSVCRDIHAARGDRRRLVAALQTIFNIVRDERTDPWEVARARTELLLAKIAHEGGNAATAAQLGEAVRGLRRRPSDGLAERARVELAGLCRPAKRVRGKTHAEDL